MAFALKQLQADLLASGHPDHIIRTTYSSSIGTDELCSPRFQYIIAKIQYFRALADYTHPSRLARRRDRLFSLKDALKKGYGICVRPLWLDEDILQAVKITYGEIIDMSLQKVLGSIITDIDLSALTECDCGYDFILLDDNNAAFDLALETCAVKGRD
ncbi:hypothetical protein DTO271G3_2335 [Paecilomyces variotii]|nr:hypothetical protein DTO271G3_2335 [Paecilomyces variotii]